MPQPTSRPATRPTSRRTARAATRPAGDRAALAALRRRQQGSVGYLLIRCGQLWNAEGIARVNAEAGRPMLGEAHTRLLPHLMAPEGIRMTALARRLDVSKQAIHQLVGDMRAAKVVEVTADPADRRARLVRLTPHGHAAIAHGTGILEAIEAELAARFGRARMRSLRQGLAALLPVLESATFRDDSR